MLIRVGHSPDPDDAFMFWALADGRIDTNGFEFEQVLRDIQTLNEWAHEGRLEVTAISAHTYPFVQDTYLLLPHGGSFGSGYGPVVVAGRALSHDELRHTEIVVPGVGTTAFLVLRFFLGGEFSYRVLPFDEILPEVMEGKAEAGLLIHEGQLTYGSHGLRKVVDLGEWWLLDTGLPLPLGLNVIRRDLGDENIHRVSEILRRSIETGLEARDEALDYALQFGRGLDHRLADRFVGMYVNDWTLDFKPRGRQAVAQFLAEGHEAGVLPELVVPEFVK